MTIIFWPKIDLSEENLIPIATKNSLLILSKDERVRQLYYGENIKNWQEVTLLQQHHPEAYSSHSEWQKEAALELSHSDGNMGTVLEFVDSVVESVDDNCKRTVISLQNKNQNNPLQVKLIYTSYYAEDVITVQTEIVHQQEKAIKLHNYDSGELCFTKRNSEFHLTYFQSDWADEFNIQEEKLGYGKRVIESKSGNRSGFDLNPSFMLSLDGPARENSGEVIAGALAWSGAWHCSFFTDNWGMTKVKSGINSYLAHYTLEPNEVFTTPEFILTHSKDGKGGASRNLHRWARNYQVYQGNRLRPTLLNSWEGVYFNFDEEKVCDMIRASKNVGCDLFVLDDGWFGNEFPRNDDKMGLGDWQVNRKKLPRGINYIANYAEEQGIKFGLWVEPEMVNPKSQLYKDHPDWVISHPGIEIIEARQQLVLDLANPAVKEFIFETVNGILTDNPAISYIKWDCNRDITNENSPYLSQDKQQNLWYDYIQSLYEIYQRLRQNHPDVIFKTCAAGGGRAEYGILKYSHEFWTSDNTDALRRVFMQWNTSHIYPACAMAAHISTSPNHQTKRVTPLKYRIDVAMSGRLGMELNPTLLSDEEAVAIKSAFKLYKEIAPIVQQGDLYRLVSPYQHNYASLMYVDEQKSSAILFAYNVHHKWGNCFYHTKLEGLDAESYYVIEEINCSEKNHLEIAANRVSGEFLMKHGLPINVDGHFESAVFKLTKLA